MKFLLDTDMCVYWLRGQSAVRADALMIDPADLAISIIALAHGVVLITNNQQYFRRIPDLQLANWLTAE